MNWVGTVSCSVPVCLSCLCGVSDAFPYISCIVAGSFGMGSGQGGVQLSAAQQMQHQQLVHNQALSGSPVSQMQMISQQQSLGLQSAPVPTNATQVIYIVPHALSFRIAESRWISASCEVCIIVFCTVGSGGSVVVSSVATCTWIKAKSNIFYCTWI